MPVIVRTMLGVLPIFLGFLFFGLCIYYVTYRFNSYGNGFFILFSLMNGDALTDCYRDLVQVQSLITNLYLYIFIAFSMW